MQTVEGDANPLYWNLIREFDKLTNTTVTMNMSFNLRGEPFVAFAADEVRMLYNSGFSAPVYSAFAVEK